MWRNDTQHNGIQYYNTQYLMILMFTRLNIEYQYVGWHFAVCLYVECRYAECRGTHQAPSSQLPATSLVRRA